ncbi:hypothetical protein TNCV_1991041 [Trichonephila clavipes]|nr:hypothetical protein TNCV_1991041 [Trichonephila clavipes]
MRFLFAFFLIVALMSVVCEAVPANNQQGQQNQQQQQNQQKNNAAGAQNAKNLQGNQNGRGSRVVKVSDRGSPCHEFEPNTTKDPLCRAVMHVKSVESSNVLPCGVVVRRGGSSGVIHVT